MASYTHARRRDAGRGESSSRRLVAASTTARYPFFAIKITDLLALDKWKPHQDLLAEGKMVEMTVVEREE